MRFLLKVNIPVEAGNNAVKAGTIGTKIQSILADLKPEAVYFVDDHGQRTALLFLDMQDASQIPAIVEPWTHGSLIFIRVLRIYNALYFLLLCHFHTFS